MGGRRRSTAPPAPSRRQTSISPWCRTKFLDVDFATKWWAGYEIKTAAVGTTSCGGVALLARKNDWTMAENAKVIGTNILSFEMVLNREERFFVVGCYFPPSVQEGEAQRLVE